MHFQIAITEIDISDLLEHFDAFIGGHFGWVALVWALQHATVAKARRSIYFFILVSMGLN